MALSVYATEDPKIWMDRFNRVCQGMRGSNEQSWRDADVNSYWNAKKNTVNDEFHQMADAIEKGMSRLSVDDNDKDEKYGDGRSTPFSTKNGEKGDAFLISAKTLASASSVSTHAAAAASGLNPNTSSMTQLSEKGMIRYRIQAGSGSWGAPTNTGSESFVRDSAQMIPSSTLSILGPANINMDGGKNPTSNFETNALAMAFGKLPGGGPVDPHQAYGFTHYHLPKEYELAPNSYNLQIIMDNVFRAGAWHVQEILPWVEWDPAYKYVLEQWIFDSGVAQRASYESAQRMMTSRRNSMSFGMLYWGIAQQSELGFWRTRTGQLHWALQKIQMKNAVVETACMGAITALLCCQQAPLNHAERRHQPGNEQDYIRLLEAQYNQIDMIKRNPHGLDLMAQRIMAVFDRVQVQYRGTLTVLLPEIINRYVVQTPERSVYLLNGIPRARFDDADAVSIKGVARIRITRPFLVNQMHTKPIDLQEEHVVVGQHGIVYSGKESVGLDDESLDHFRTSDLDFQMYCFEKDDIVNIPYQSVSHASCLYSRSSSMASTQNRGGYRLTKLGRKYFFNWRKHPHVNYDDFMKNSGKYGRYRAEWPDDHIHLLNNDDNVMTVGDFYRDADVGNNGFFQRIVKKFMNKAQKETSFAADFQHEVLDAIAGKVVHPPDFKTLESVAGVLNKVPLTTAHYFEFCMHHNIPIFLAFKWSQPFITIKAVSVIGLADVGSARLGSTLVGRGMYLVGTTPKTGMVSGTLTYHSNSVVPGFELVHNMRAPFVTGYIEGGSDEFWDYEDIDTYKRWKQSSGPSRNPMNRYQFCHMKPTQSMFAEVLPLGEKEQLPAYMAFSGRWSEMKVGPSSDNNRTRWEWQTNTAHWYSQLWNRQPLNFEPYTNQTVFYNDMRPCDGDITHQALQIFKVREGTKVRCCQYLRDRGWLPRDIQPRMREYLEGIKPLNTVAIYTQPQNGFVEIINRS